MIGLKNLLWQDFLKFTQEDFSVMEIVICKWWWQNWNHSSPNSMLQVFSYKFYGEVKKKKLFWQILMATMTGDKWSTSVGPDILIHYQGSASSVWPSSDQNRNVWFVFRQFKNPNFLAFPSANILISKKKSLYFFTTSWLLANMSPLL